MSFETVIATVYVNHYHPDQWPKKNLQYILYGGTEMITSQLKKITVL